MPVLNIKNKHPLSVDINLNTIQAIRMAWSLCESDYLIHVDKKYEYIFLFLNQFFKIDYGIGLENIKRIDKLTIDHSTPSCSIGRIKRPLIFPKGLISRCKSKWQKERESIILFSGLVTPKRYNTIQNWISTNSNQISLKSKLDLLRIKSKTRDIQQNLKKVPFNISEEIFLPLNKELDFDLYISSIGRKFPEKAWDDSYYNKMTRAKFVLCPNGDFIWTYRFFESIFCGAIPIIEEESTIYNGFLFYKMGDPTKKYIYDETIVMQNLKIAEDLLSIQKNLLNEAIQEILKG